MARYRYDENPPVWAGVVVRLADGTTYAAQIKYPTNATFTREMDSGGSFSDWREPVWDRPAKVRIEIEGYEGAWHHDANIPNPEEIEPARKAIEA